MKYRILACSCLMASLFLLNACTKVDNYAEPGAKVSGRIIDKQGRPVYANTGNSSVRIKMLDYGYSANPSEYYLNIAMDGSYVNNKIFASTYTMVPQGPFVPVPGQEGIKIGNDTKVDFVVEPFFVVEWREPALIPNGDGTVTANVRITRGTDNASYQGDPNQVLLFISTTEYVGSNNYDQRLTPVLTGAAAKAFLNTNASITSVTAGTSNNRVELKSGYTYYIRAGVRGAMNGDIPQAYNFSETKKITMP